MISKVAKIQIRFCLAMIGFYLATFAQLSSLNAFTGPSETDMPPTIKVKGKFVSLHNLKTPIIESKQTYMEGSKVYIENCTLCHGDLLDGKGLYGESFFPRPANFLNPKSILSKSKSYAYWRIMKGGRSLPEQYNPWDSAMPAWEGILNDKDVWNVIQYIYTMAQEVNQANQSSIKEASIDRGKKVYDDKCSICHGNTGGGDGPGAKISSPFPRNFTKGHIKFRSTSFGKIPTDKNLFDAISRGSPGTTMPSWKHLPETDRHSLVLYLKTLSKKFTKFVKKRKTHKVVIVPDPPSFTLESIERGKELFIQNCSACHGIKGRSDGVSTKKIVNLATDATWPRNLTQPWKFRRGEQRKQIFLTLRTGLSMTAMPMFSKRVFKDEQIWDMVHYVQTLSLSQKPKISPVLKVQKLDGALPSNPGDSKWKTIDSNFYPLGGQIIQSKKIKYPIIDSVVVKALHNGSEIAFYLHWDDPTVDPILKNLVLVKESPAPPLPAHLQVDEPEEEQVAQIPQPQKFPDSIAIQFPVSVNSNRIKPYFLNGDSKHPVNLWKWSSHPMKALELNAAGVDQIIMQANSSQSLSSKASYEYGRYSLVIKRRLNTVDTQNDIQFRSGQNIPVAFNAWNGSAGETESQKVISSWFKLRLE